MPRAASCVLAAATTAAALGVALLLHPVLDATSYLVFVAAVAVVAAFAGLGPALLTTVLAVLAIDFFFMAPVRSLALLVKTDLLALAVFGGVAVLVSGLVERLRRRSEAAQRQAREAAGLASLFHRHANALEDEVDALHVLRSRRPPGA